MKLFKYGEETMSQVIILLTNANEIGAEMYAIKRGGGITRDRSEAARFHPDIARDFIENHEGDGPYKGYRMFIDDGKI